MYCSISKAVHFLLNPEINVSRVFCFAAKRLSATAELVLKRAFDLSKGGQINFSQSQLIQDPLCGAALEKRHGNILTLELLDDGGVPKYIERVRRNLYAFTDMGLSYYHHSLSG